MIASSYSMIVVGLGVTGFSCAKYLAKKGVNFAVVDTRTNPPYLEKMKQQMPDVTVRLGPLSSDFLTQADELVVSPGLALAEPAIQYAMDHGVRLTGDIELFLREVQVPVIAITGSNGKSTLTTLIGEIIKAAGIEVGVGGNIGVPVLDLLNEKQLKKFYVLELSSFQLEIIQSLDAHVSLFLNVSPDHMDRYTGMGEYIKAKKRIYKGCNISIYNLDDDATYPDDNNSGHSLAFTLKDPGAANNCFGVRTDQDKEQWLVQGNQILMNIKELPLTAPYYQSNMLAAFAVAHALDIPPAVTRATIKAFDGLRHRCQKVREARGISWFNDSKATNISAASASIKGLGSQCCGRLIVLLGGQGKGADFSQLKPDSAKYADILIVFGDDGHEIQQALSGAENEIINATELTFEAIVAHAYNIAEAGDYVLLAPACASFDMFKHFEDRGDQFIKYVNALAY